MAGDIFVNLSIIILLAVLISGIMRLLKQPLLIGYIITGIIVGPYLFNIISSNTIFETFSKIGIALLLFMVGLHLNPKVIKDVGGVSLITGLGQVIFTSLIGFLIARAFGFSNLVSLYVAVALTFSSTIIIMKLLSDKRDLETLYGRISIGFLIVQDLVAIFALMLISSLSNNAGVSGFVFGTLVKGLFAILIVLFFGFFILPRFNNFFAKSQEFLFLFSIGLCFAVASLFQYLNFSIEIGALLAGITLSLSPYSQEISSKMKPLRDFFIVLFFILLGSQMVLGDITKNIVPIIVFSVFIIIGNPIIVIILMGLLGYTKRNSFLAGLTVAQISEFSLILIALGIKVGHLSSDVLSMVTMIGLITIGGSTYMILYAEKIYPFFSKFLSVFEKKKLKDKKYLSRKYDTILFGYNRIGFNVLRALKKSKRSYLVVDFNPEIISDLKKLRIPCLYGDAYDAELLDELPLDKLKLAISTIPDFETNFLLIEKMKLVNPKAIIIVRADQIKDALYLYRKGADYVLTPHFLGGEYVAKMIREIKTNEKGYEVEKERHMEMLREILKKKR